MAKGGPRNRNGRSPDPFSARSDMRGIEFLKLPAEGYGGTVPDFPLPARETFRNEELALWQEVWTYPQAAAWSKEPWRWVIIAEYCRFTVEAEAEPKASLIAQLHRYRDQLGLSPAGLRENQWIIDHSIKMEVALEPPPFQKRRSKEFGA